MKKNKRWIYTYKLRECDICLMPVSKKTVDCFNHCRRCNLRLSYALMNAIADKVLYKLRLPLRKHKLELICYDVSVTKNKGVWVVVGNGTETTYFTYCHPDTIETDIERIIEEFNHDR